MGEGAPEMQDQISSLSVRLWLLQEYHQRVHPVITHSTFIRNSDNYCYY